jgi:hypothetical protein
MQKILAWNTPQRGMFPLHATPAPDAHPENTRISFTYSFAASLVRRWPQKIYRVVGTRHAAC